MGMLASLYVHSYVAEGRVVLAWMAGVCISTVNEGDFAEDHEMSLIATTVPLNEYI